jgi:gamma-glutamylcyclotransferase (GGCT)/AIG2-like uncharacterized protein YtfP
VKTPHVLPGPFQLFVYGTLKRDGCRHWLLAGQSYRGEAHTLPRYGLYHLGDYPGLIACPQRGQAVRGELYEVDPCLLGCLDETEGAPVLFDLGPVELAGVAGPAWTYFYQLDPADRPLVESGIWENC